MVQISSIFLLIVFLLSACSSISGPNNNIVEITEAIPDVTAGLNENQHMPDEIQTRKAYPVETAPFSTTMLSTPTNSVMPLSDAPVDCVIRIGVANGNNIRPLLGVNAGPVPAGSNQDNPDLTQAYQRIGVNMVRTHDYYGPLDMGAMYPNQDADPDDPASYQFKSSDQVFRAILAGGFEPYFRLGDSWNVRGLLQRAPANPDNWIRAAEIVIRRYYEMSLKSGVPMHYVEIWNEPDNRQFWDGTKNEFFDLFTRTASTIKHAFPDLKVGGPALTPAGALTPRGKQLTSDFLSYLQSHHAALDFFSWHIYANDPETFTTAAMFYREQLDAFGFVNTESHITEWNTAIKQSRETGAVDLRYTARGASIMSAAWIGLQEQGVDVSTFYRGPDPDINDPRFYGMFYADGNPKPIALAFALWAELVDHPAQVSATVEPRTDLWLLAGENGMDEVALLIANPGGKSLVCQVIPPETAAQNKIIIKRVSEPNTEIRTFVAGMIVEIPAFSTQLLLLNP